MTVSYTLSVSTSHPWTFLRLLFRWKGSIWKAVWMQLAVWLALYVLVAVTYRFLLTEPQKEEFTNLVDYTRQRLKYIPLDLILGFFVTAIVNRWNYLYNIIGFLDNIGLMTAEYVRGTSEKARMYRRNIVRYCELTQVLVFRDLSLRARKRFPTLDTVEAAGFMTPHEHKVFDEIQYRYSKYWLPFQWALALTYNARRDGFIESDYYEVVVSEEIKKFRTDLAWLCNYDWVPLPMIYPTIVCLSVHIYFLVTVVAHQFVDGTRNHNGDDMEHYFLLTALELILSMIQFVLYMGWLKTGEVLLNPWGEDDDDFEVNVLIDRNLAMALKMVDDGYGKTPEPRRDAFWDDDWTPLYSEASARRQMEHPEGSVSHIKLPSRARVVRMVPLHGESLSLPKIASREKIRGHSTRWWKTFLVAAFTQVCFFHPRKFFSEKLRNRSRPRLSQSFSQDDDKLPRKVRRDERKSMGQVFSTSQLDTMQSPTGPGTWFGLRRKTRADTTEGVLEMPPFHVSLSGGSEVIRDVEETPANGEANKSPHDATTITPKKEDDATSKEI